MNMKITIPGYGTTLTGSPVTILRIMQDARLFDKKKDEDLIEEITHTIWRAFGIGLQVEGNTLAERAESLLREMAKNEIVKIEEE